MRILLVLLSLAALTSCTTSTNTGTSTPTGTVKSQISSEKYSPELQKTIPSPTYGSGKHDVTVYADFQCPACLNFSQWLGKVFESYADAWKITITYKQFPLTSIHKNAYRDAIAALCSAEQGKYNQAKDAIYMLESQKKGATVTDAERVTVLSSVWLDAAALTQCLADNRYAKQVDEEVIAGDRAGVSGTPTVMLNGTRLDLGVVFADAEKGKAFLDRVFAQ